MIDYGLVIMVGAVLVGVAGIGMLAWVVGKITDGSEE